MTLKAIQRNPSIGVAAPAEIVGLFDHAVTGFTGMAIDATFQAEFRRAHAAMHGVIALMLDKFHVVLFHKRGVGYALRTTFGIDDRSWHAARLARQRAAARQTNQQYAPRFHSPSPIWI